MTKQTPPRASWQEIHDNLARAIELAEQNTARIRAIREGQRLLDEIWPQLRSDIGGPYNTD